MKITQAIDAARMFEALGACEAAVNWAEGRSLEECWQECQQIDWMLWALAQLPPREEVATFTVWCALRTGVTVAGEAARSAREAAGKAAEAAAKARAYSAWSTEEELQVRKLRELVPYSSIALAVERWARDRLRPSASEAKTLGYADGRDLVAHLRAGHGSGEVGLRQLGESVGDVDDAAIRDLGVRQEAYPHIYGYSYMIGYRAGVSDALK